MFDGSLFFWNLILMWYTKNEKLYFWLERYKMDLNILIKIKVDYWIEEYVYENY